MKPTTKEYSGSEFRFQMEMFGARRRLHAERSSVLGEREMVPSQCGDRETENTSCRYGKIIVLEIYMEPARGTLQKIVAEMLAQVPAEQAPVVAWQFVCGKRVADRTEALAFAEGVLRVEVPDATWRTQLTDLTPRYLELLRQYTGQKIVRLEFVVGKGSK